MENCVRKAVDGRNINHKGQGLWVSLKLLSGDIKQVGILLHEVPLGITVPFSTMTEVQ